MGSCGSKPNPAELDQARRNTKPRPMPESQATKQPEVQEKQSKIILMGNLQVGKTSIIQSFMENSSMREKKVLKTDVIQDFTKIIDVSDSEGT